MWIVQTGPKDGNAYGWDPSMPGTSKWRDMGQFKGDKGDQGVQGIAGPIGNTGAAGAIGVVGPKGIQGVKGDKGAAGKNGTGIVVKGSKDNEAAIKTVTGSVAGDMWIAKDTGQGWVSDGNTPAVWTNAGNIQGPKGDIGPSGIQGNIGATGAQGAIGPKGDPGVKGDPGTDGTKGVKGDSGPKGLTGPVGPQGVQGAKGPIGTTPDVSDFIKKSGGVFTNMPKVGTAPMVVSGKTGNGNWVKYADGTLIQYIAIISPTYRPTGTPITFTNILCRGIFSSSFWK